MRFGDKLIQLRRERGYSQEQLANILDVSRQSVSKWEAGQSTPEITKLITIADIFGVTVDSLVREEASIPDLESKPSSETYGHPMRQNIYGFYEYKSKKKLFGIPLVHVKLGYGIQVAKGIIAIGNISVGLISIGGISVGGICIGGLALGLLALAGLAIGGIAIGGCALGIIAMGGVAIGMYSTGGIAFASKVAVGGVAYGHTAIGARPRGVNILKVTDSVRYDQIRDFILKNHPKIWKPLLRFMAFVGEMTVIN